MKVLVSDERDVLSTEPKGMYVVRRINTIARFQFGGNGTYQNAAEAHTALCAFLRKRKDVCLLRVQLVEFIN